MIYLDYAAATPLSDEALKAMQPYWQLKFHNPSGISLSARSVRADIEEARKIVARLLGVKPGETVFTAGGTESINLAIRGIMSQPKSQMVTTSIEHEAVLATAAEYDNTIVKVDKSGLVDPDKIAKAITDKTVLVSVMYANNEIGTIQPLAKIAEQIRAIRAKRVKRGIKLPLYFHSDAAQAGAYLDLSVPRLGVDLMSLNGGKVYGPKQSGLLYVRGGVQLQPQITGGGQELNLRSGTENVAAIIGFARALANVQAKRKSEVKRQSQLRDLMWQDIKAALPTTSLNGHSKKRLPNNLNFSLPGLDGERAVMALDEAGLIVATGSACAALSDEPSHVLCAIGRSVAEASASLRISLGQPTTKKAALSATKTIIKYLKSV